MIRHLYRLWPHPGLLLRLGLLTTVLAILQGLLLGLLVPVLRAVLRPEPDFAAARPWLITGAAGLLLFAVLKVIATPVTFAASTELATQLRRHLMRHVTTLPLGWFTAEHKARLARTVTSAAGGVAQLTATFGPQAITGLLVPVTVVGVTFAVDRLFALLFLLTLPVAFVVLRHSARITAAADRELDEAATAIAGRAIEFGQAQSVLRAAGQGTTGSVRMREALDEHRGTYRRGLRRTLIPDLSFTGVVMTGFVVVLVLGARYLLSGALSVPDTVALFVLAVRFLEPLGTLAESIATLHAMDNNISRVEKVLGTPALPRSPHPVRRMEHAGIEFSDVVFRYGATTAPAPAATGTAADSTAATAVTVGPPALSGVSFHCRPGTTTALVGPSGSGKTTVTRLIARFSDVASGQVRVGGVDVRDYDHAALLGEIAIVFQDVYLFDTTIEENVRIARPEATDAELRAAAREARLDEVVDRLPDGWLTRVGEAGAQLSGGERQRVSIARAFLKQARIVLIDEAASALDPENESAIGDAIAGLGRQPDRTVIVIAHRPATLSAADQVVTLDAGQVTETGTPAELRDSGGMFAHLYHQYEQARSWHITATRTGS